MNRQELETEIKSLEAQKKQAEVVMCQADGAIQALQMVLSKLPPEEPKDHLTMDEVAEMVGGPGATAEMIDA